MWGAFFLLDSPECNTVYLLKKSSCAIKRTIMSRFVVVNAILLALFGAFLLGTSSNGIRLAHMNTKDIEKSPNYVAMSALMEVTINPVVYMLGMILFIIANAVMFSKQNGVTMTKARYGWGALCLCLLAFVTLMVPALMVPLMNYLGTTVKEVKDLGTGFQVLVIARLLISALFVLAGGMAIKSNNP